MKEFKTKVCLRCGSEFLPNSGSQKYCLECRDIVRKSQISKNKKIWREKHSKKNRICLRCGKPYIATDSVQKYCKECIPIEKKEHSKKWMKEHPQKRYEYSKRDRIIHAKRYHDWFKSNPEKLKEYYKKHDSKRRQLDFIPLNQYFKDSVAHHIDKTYVIYIPEEIHQNVYHSVLRNYNMDEINAIAFNYL